MGEAGVPTMVPGLFCAVMPLTHRGRRAKGTALALVLVLLAGCRPEPSGQGPSAGRQRLTVLTTFVPITLFTRAVAGTCAEVRALIPPQIGPHDFQARPSDLAALRRARVLVKNGLGIEAFLDRLLATADRTQLRVIDSSAGIETIASGQRRGEAQHDHAHDHDPAETGGHEGHAHGPINPHIWLDPLRAAQQVGTIRDGLVAADPACAETYRRNAAQTVAALTRLNGEIARDLKPYRGKTFVAFHDFAPYFAQRYGLQAEFLVDVPQVNPSPADMQRVAGIVRRSQLQALLSEPQGNEGSFNALARDLGIRVSEFDGLETSSADLAEAASAGDPAGYVKVMRTNVKRLRQAFGG